MSTARAQVMERIRNALEEATLDQLLLVARICENMLRIK